MLREISVSKAEYPKYKDTEPGTTWSGVYTGKRESKDYPGAFTYFIKNDEHNFGLSGAGSLKYVFDSRVQEGDYVVVTYLGMEQSKSGKSKGKLTHQFKVQVDDDKRTTPATNAKPVEGMPF